MTQTTGTTTGKTAETPLPSTSRPEDLPDIALDLLDVNKTRRGLIYSDGRIAALGPALLADLGFDDQDDLNGLAFVSFWHHAERAAVTAALRRVRTEGTVRLNLDLSYMQDRDGTCLVTLEPAATGGLILVDLDCKPSATSG